MKKSKVLVPAMALLLFSTAASITGTVAWFTSTRTFETSTGDFEVAKLEGNLSCEATQLIGTSVTDNVISIATDGSVGATKAVLGDASFDHTQKKLYTDTDVVSTYELLDTMAATSPAENGFTGTVNNWKYNTVGTTTYWYAVAWNLTFSYQFVAETTNVNVFFNINASTMTPTQTVAHASGNDTAKGFRIAFLSNSSAKVWGKLCDKNCMELNSSSSWVSKDGGYNPAYVSSTTGTTAYTSSNFIDSTTTLAAATNSTTNQTSRLDYLATITNPGDASSASVTVTCVAWYEGTDPNVVDASRMTKVKTSMSFYACNANS